MFREGDPASHLSIILKGEVNIQYTLGNDEFGTVDTLVEGDLLMWCAGRALSGNRVGHDNEGNAAGPHRRGQTSPFVRTRADTGLSSDDGSGQAAGQSPRNGPRAVGRGQDATPSSILNRRGGAGLRLLAVGRPCPVRCDFFNGNRPVGRPGERRRGSGRWSWHGTTAVSARASNDSAVSSSCAAVTPPLTVIVIRWAT